MQEQNDDLERMLGRYRPVGPGSTLRERVLAASLPSPALPPVSPPAERGAFPMAHEMKVALRGAWLYRAAMAASLLLAIGLSYAAGRINRATAANIGIGPVMWTADAEQAATLVGGGESGRQYIALCLMASSGGRQSQGGSQFNGANQ